MKASIEESVRRYSSTKAISKAVNELLKKVLRGEADILKLIRAEKIAEVSAKEFEEFRRELSRRLES